MIEEGDDQVEVDNVLDVRAVVEDEVGEEVGVEDGVVNPDVDDLVDRPDHENENLKDAEGVLNRDDVDEVVVLDNHRSGMSLLTPMATHTGVGFVIHGVDVIQDDEDDVIEDLEDEFEVVDVVSDLIVVVKGLENDFL